MCRLRQAEKKKRKLPLHVKNPIKKKDPKKLALGALENKMVGAGLTPAVQSPAHRKKKEQAPPLA